jgi:EpsI family protein
MRAARNARLYWIAALACLTALVYWPSTIFLYEKWSAKASVSGTYSHGWLILLICIGLVVRARRDLAAAPVRHSPVAAVALAAAIVLWLVSYRASIEGLQVPLQPLIFWLAVSTAFGAAVGRVLLFPVAYFYFAEPIWYGTQLQHLTLLVTRSLLAVTGPTASIVGDVIRLPNGTFVIEEGCSGLHFMIVGLAVAALYGEQRRDSWPVRLRLLALMAGLALLANWVRVYTVIEAGYLTDMQSYLVRVSHYGFGWCVFAVALLVFFWLAPRLAPESAAPPAAAAPAPVLAGVPRCRAELGGVVLVVVILIALPLLSAQLRALSAAPPLSPPAPSLDPQLPWRAVLVDVRSAWLPIFAGADELQRRAFGNGAGETVEVLWVAYRTQRQGAELVGETSSLTGDGLRASAERMVGSTAGRFCATEVTDRTGGRSLIWSRYQVDGRNLVHPLTQQLWYGIKALIWRPSAGLIALRTPCDGNCGRAGRTLQDFVAHSGMR